MGRLLVRRRLAQLSDVGLGGAELPEQAVDGLLLREDDVAELGNLALEMGVADLQVHESRFHGGPKATTPPLSNQREEPDQPFGARREHREIGRHAIRLLLHLFDEPRQDLPFTSTDEGRRTLDLVSDDGDDFLDDMLLACRGQRVERRHHVAEDRDLPRK